MLTNCRMKYPYSCFPFHFCFLVVSYQPCRFSLSLLSFIQPLSRPIDLSTLFFMLTSALPPSFLVTCCLCMSSMGCKTIYVVTIFLALSSMNLNYFIVHFKNGFEYITSRQPWCLSLCWGGCSRGVMVKAMDCGIIVREFVLQSRYYVHFRANTLGKGMNPLILPAMG